MSVWLTIPSKRPPEEVEPVLKQWRERGYKIALWRDYVDAPADCNFLQRSLKYPGYAKAVNHLIGCLLDLQPDAEWFIAAGDDVLPDPNHTAEEIARKCRDHFEGLHQARGFDRGLAPIYKIGLFGVMQPTGDRWGDKNGAYIDRVAGSAWIGREFARRVNHGRGPLWPEYFHMFVDEELQEVATGFGVFWQCSDLTQLHQHWGRPHEGEKLGQASRMPAFLRKANDQFAEARELFNRRKAQGFPGSELVS